MKRFFAGHNSIVITSMILGLPVLGVVVPEIMPNVVSKSEEAAFHVATPYNLRGRKRNGTRTKALVV